MIRQIKTKLKEWLLIDNKTYFKSLSMLQSDAALQYIISQLLEKTGLNMAYLIELREYLIKIACVYQFFSNEENVMAMILIQARNAVDIIKNNSLLSSIKNAKIIKSAYICALIITVTAIRLHEVQKFSVTLSNDKKLNFYTFDFLAFEFKKPIAITAVSIHSKTSYSMNVLLALNIISTDLKKLIFSHPTIANDFMASLLNIERSTADSSYTLIQSALAGIANNVTTTEIELITINSSITEVKPYTAMDFLQWLETQINHDQLFVNDEEGMIYALEEGWFIKMPDTANLWHQHIRNMSNPSVLENILKQENCINVQEVDSSYANLITGKTFDGLQIKKQLLKVTQSYPREYLIKQEVNHHA